MTDTLDRDRRVALVTYGAAPELTRDDRLLQDALAARGIASDAVAWDDPTACWHDYGLVVVRSCWDYHLRPAEFRAWIDRVESNGAALRNPPAVLRWNADKRYLRDVEAAGVPIVPTRWTDTDDTLTLDDVLRETGWRHVVVKPAVSAQAHETWRASADTLGDDAPRFAALVRREPLLVQPFVDAITESGEWSLLFFGGVFSHAVLKRPADGDFRVQNEHGGTHRAVVPPPPLIDDAARALACAPAPCLYARIDGCVIDGRLHVMELELLEPSLYLAESPHAPARLADAIVALVRQPA